ncbi:MAG: sugar ABC transporter permease [Chloroflexi bacterium OHK40]|jgi:multiple sugar transport system permease protein
MATTVTRKPAQARPWLSKQLRNDLRAYAFISPWLLSLVVFTGYPMLATIYFSLTDYTIVQPPQWVGLENYQRMFTADPQFWPAVWNTTFYAVISVPLSLVVALGLALLLNQNVRGVGIYRTIYYLPTMVPAVAGALLWTVILDPQNGLLNSMLESVGLPGPGWLKSAEWSKPALILMALWAGTGSAMLIFLAGLKDIPQTLYEAATIDGASSWQRLMRITLPLLTPTIFFNLIMGIIASFQVFGQILASAGSGGTVGPLNSLLMYMVLLYRSAFRSFEMGYASALALVLFVFLVLLTMLVVRSSRHWVYYEGEHPG